MISHPHVKINLGLNVIRKREDGFHDLETLFVPYYDISDRLEIILAEDFSHISSELFGKYGKQEGNQGPCLVQDISEDGKLMITIARKEGINWSPLKDLCAKAYFILAEDFELPPVKIFLEKTSPVGAGLGGGSSDAAFALKMINELCGLSLSTEELAVYAAKLGSDCAFFLHNEPMLGKGRGNELSLFKLNNLDYGQKGGESSEYEIKVITQENIHVSTADAYRGIEPQNPALCLEKALLRPIEEWKEVVKNDFEETVFAKYPQLRIVKESLYESGAIYAAMSGSGSALFAIYKK